MRNRSFAVLVLLVLTQLAACSGLRPASSGRGAPSSGTPPPAASENPGTSPPPDSSPANNAGTPPSAGSNEGSSPPTADNRDQGSAPGAATVPVCLPPTPKAQTVQPKPKPAARQTPPPITPAGPGAASGNTVNAEVRPMTVPVMSILGKRVEGAKGEDLGRVVDVLADAQGRVRIAIIDFGGFLGVGDRRIAVDWPLLRFEPGRDPVVLTVSEDQLKSAPEFKDGPRPQTLMVPAAAEPVPTAGIAAAADSKK
jgi:hypothetical protein